MQRPKITALQLTRTGVPEGTVRISIKILGPGVPRSSGGSPPLTLAARLEIILAFAATIFDIVLFFA